MPLRMNSGNATHPREPHHSSVDRNLWETPHILAFMAKPVTCLSTHDKVNPPSQGWEFKRQMWADTLTKQFTPTVSVGDQTFAFDLFSRGNSSSIPWVCRQHKAPLLFHDSPNLLIYILKSAKLWIIHKTMYTNVFKIYILYTHMPRFPDMYL